MQLRELSTHVASARCSVRANVLAMEEEVKLCVPVLISRGDAVPALIDCR